MRRTKTVTIPGTRSENLGERDNEKTFSITEMCATAGDEWLTQCGYLLSKKMQEFPALNLESQEGSLILLRVLKDHSLIAWRDCVKYQHDPRHPLQAINWNSDGCQVEEIATINMLLMEVYQLHTGFFSPESASTTDLSSTMTMPVGSSVMRTSRHPSARLSPQGAQR